MKKMDFLAIGDTVIDAFIKLTDADRVDVRGVPDHEDYKICLPYADKIPYEDVIVVNAVGNAANAAVSAARLGLRTGLVTNVGGDLYGRDCIRSLEHDGVSTKFVRVNKKNRTNYHYVLWYKTERTILIKHEQYPYELPKIGEPGWVYFSSVGKTAYPFHDTVAEYLEKHPGIKLAFQPGKNEIALGRDKMARLYRRSNIFFANVEEARTILESSSDDVLELSKGIEALGPKIVCISDGPNGAYYYERGQLWHMPLYPDIAPPLERTGAGDAFSSTFTAALALGLDPLTAFAWGPINSMSVVQGVGAQAGLLSRKALEAYLAKAPADYKPKKIN